MSPTGAAQLAFAAESAVFLVSAAGLICALRPRLLSDVGWSRSSLTAGFLGLATLSFLHGSLIVADVNEPVLVTAQLASIGLVALGAIRWRAGPRGLLAVAVGVGALVAGTLALHVGPGHPALADGCRLVGAAALGAAIVSAGRRSVSARIVVNAAVLLLAVVLAVSLAVSFTVSRNVQDEAGKRFAARAANEADRISQQAQAALAPAKLIAGELTGGRAAQLAALLPGGPAAGRAAARGAIGSTLSDLTDDRLLGIADPVVFVGAAGSPEAAVPASLDNTTRLALAGDPVAQEALRARAPRQGVAVVRGRGYALAVVPTFVRVSGRPERFAGEVLLARRLDDTYLRVLGTAGEPLSFALIDRDHVLARSGAQPPIAVLGRVADQVVGASQSPRAVIGSRLVTAAPVSVAPDQPPVMAFVVSVPTSALDTTRQALFRNLFVVALAATLVALLLAVVVGERIGAGLRRLTAAAERLRGGDFDAPVVVRSADELGVLGATFESMAGSIRDMTGDLRRAAADEAWLRARLEAVVAGMGEALVAVDRTGQVIQFNDAAEELLGVPRSRALGAPVGETVRVVVDGHGPAAIDLAVLTMHVPTEVEVAVAIGPSVAVVLTAGTLRDAEGRPDGAVLVLRDVRRERQVEEMKTSFLANISHELRTPLTPIKGYAGVLRDRDVGPERTRAFAVEIAAGVTQMERVIGQLVTFATIAAGRLDLDTESLDSADLIAHVVDRWRGRLDGARAIQLESSAGLPAITADRTHLARAVDELIDNALKYSPDGGDVVVRVAVAVPGRADGEPTTNGNGAPSGVVISVTDRGVGIQADELARLTDDFAQGDASATRRFGGLGLGLAYVERIVVAHGGRLRFRSTPGRGTTVSILLPVAERVPGEERLAATMKAER